MKVYAVFEICCDDCTDFDVIIGDHVYLKEEDAKKRLEELVEEHHWTDYKIRDFEVKE